MLVGYLKAREINHNSQALQQIKCSATSHTRRKHLRITSYI